MKRYQIYQQGSLDEYTLVFLDLGGIPERESERASQEAHDIFMSPPVGEGDTIEEVYIGHPQLCGFQPWTWKESGGWKPGGLDRELLIRGQKALASRELVDSVRGFLDAYGGLFTEDDIRAIVEEALSR